MQNKDSNIEIEQMLLGLIFINSNAALRVKGLLRPEDFFEQKHQIIFKYILKVLDSDLDFEIGIFNKYLDEENQLEKIGGWNYISQLINKAGLEVNLNKYIEEIVEKSQLRNLKKIVVNLAQNLDKKNYSSKTLMSELEKHTLDLVRINKKYKDFVDINQIVKEALKELENQVANKGISGLSSDFPSLDTLTSGFQRGDLIILAARPSMGKTAFALNIAANIAKNNNNVAFFSLEMSSRQLINRIFAFTSFISISKLRDPNKMDSDEWHKIYLAADEIKKMNLFIDDSPGLTISELLWKARRLSKQQKLDFIVIDYLQLLSTVGNNQFQNRQVEVSIISRKLKQLSRELNIPIMALSQLSRKVELRENKIPMMSDLRESGAIEQDADIVAFLYREAYYDLEKIKDIHQIMDIIISKHRNGAIGKIELSFNPILGLFTDLKKN